MGGAVDAMLPAVVTMTDKRYTFYQKYTANDTEHLSENLRFLSRNATVRGHPKPVEIDCHGAYNRSKWVVYVPEPEVDEHVVLSWAGCFFGGTLSGLAIFALVCC